MVFLWISEFLPSLMPESLDDITEIHRSSIMIDLSILVLHDEVDGLITLGALACSLYFLFAFRMILGS